jgi:hypothetical protein
MPPTFGDVIGRLNPNDFDVLLKRIFSSTHGAFDRRLDLGILKIGFFESSS